MAHPVLLAVDFSEPSMKALEAAAALAKDLEAPIVLVHVFDPIPDIPEGAWTPVVDPSRPYRFERKVEEARELSGQWAGRLRQEGLDVTTVALEGEIVDGVLREAEEREAMMIVVGSHGWGGLKRLILGSVSEKIVRRSRRPVMVVPAHE